MKWLSVLIFFIPGIVLMLDIDPAEKALIFAILIVAVLLFIVAT